MGQNCACGGLGAFEQGGKLSSIEKFYPVLPADDSYLDDCYNCGKRAAGGVAYRHDDSGALAAQGRKLLQSPQYRDSENKNAAEVHKQSDFRLAKAVKQSHYRRIDAQRNRAHSLQTVDIPDHLGKLRIVSGKKVRQRLEAEQRKAH